MLNRVLEAISALAGWARRLWRQNASSSENERNHIPLPDKTRFDPPENLPSAEDPDSAKPTEDSPHVRSGDANTDTRSEQKSVGAPPKEEKPEIPRNIGGRRRGRGIKTQQPLKGDTENKHLFATRPELICRQGYGEWQWEVNLRANNDSVKAVWHAGEPLDMVNGECSLPSFRGRLSIVSEDPDLNELKLFDGEPLLFKLHNNWRGEGRKVGGITSGYFIVITPKDWKRIGHVPVEPRGCTDENFMAHYFYRGGSAQDIGGFDDYSLPLTTSGFELSGDRVFDDSEEGELFVNAPPKLKCAPGVAWARVGQEGQGGWKGENFNPYNQLLAEILNGRQGYFFVRVYDGSVKLVDSGEFRYLRDLKEIRVIGEKYSANTLLVPPPTGYASAKVSFIGAEDAGVRPVLPPEGVRAKVKGGEIEVEPHPDADHVFCQLKSGSGCVDVVLNLPRIWWRIERARNESGDWRDRPLAMTQKTFHADALADTKIRLCLPSRIQRVVLGFDDELD